MRKDESMDDLKESGELAQLSTRNQPPADLKKLGWARKKLLREVLQCKVPGSNKMQMRKLARLFDLTPGQMTIELAMNLAQIDKALNGDTASYRALMDRAYGHPVTPIVNNNNNLKIEIVYGNNPVGEIPHIDG